VKVATFIFLTALVTGCSTEQGLPRTAPPSPTFQTSPVFGDWRWTRSCNSVVEALRRAGLEERIRQLLVDARYFAHEDLIDVERPCKGAEETRYVYFFEETGRFGVIDDDDVLVDDREFVIIDDATIVVDGVTVGFRIDGHMLTFAVHRPDDCDSACEDSYAWAAATLAPARLRRIAGA
jgi:hypothetical protein